MLSETNTLLSLADMAHIDALHMQLVVVVGGDKPVKQLIPKPGSQLYYSSWNQHSVIPKTCQFAMQNSVHLQQQDLMAIQSKP